ncbi:MAG: MBL fold metallo-hydrolase [Acidimicrobiales bacterium]
MADRVVALAPGVWRVPTLGRDLVNSFFFDNGDGTVSLLDVGLRGATPRLVRALAEVGKQPGDVTSILVTHAHRDHIGSARKMRGRTGARLAVHHDDAHFVESGSPPPYGSPGPLATVLRFVDRRQPRSPVDGTFTDGELLPAGGGLRVLHTPGHSPGHCSFLHEPTGVLVTGDALFNFRARITYSGAYACSDFAMSKDTAERLGDADYEIAAFTHGPEVRTGARQAVREFLERRRRS